jgi:pyruvate/2-oxoglutarate dehydrogenase complex dihydrolipoamide acyltransferase (E2) component
MASGIYVPRINNNDDEVKLVGVGVVVGSQVTRGQTIAQVETDKAVVDVEADSDGYVLSIAGNVDDTLRVGSVLVWIGASADEKVPQQAQHPVGAADSPRSVPTAKASALLAQHGLTVADVPASGERLTTADVERYLAMQAGVIAHVPALVQSEAAPEVAGELRQLKSVERGMLSTVVWHRDMAVPGYIEVAYEPADWEKHAEQFGVRHNLLLNPLLPLMSWRLVELACDTPRLNATIVGNGRFEFSEINLGFTVQAADVLYLAVVRNSASLGELGFVSALVELQRRAAAHKLGPLETRGATIGFSSMARWKVSRHIPILPPHTALMVAHATDHNGSAVLGATYDHRVLNGAEVAATLRKLARPGKAP